MILKAVETRREIACRLRDVVSLPDASMDQSDSYDTCDFFRDDLAFDPPYESMVGLVIFLDEVEQFAAFMALLNEACTRSRLGEPGEELIRNLQVASRELLRTMIGNGQTGFGVTPCSETGK